VRIALKISKDTEVAKATGVIPAAAFILPEKAETFEKTKISSSAVSEIMNNGGLLIHARKSLRDLSLTIHP
jgi:hypothetical protein